MIIHGFNKLTLLDYPEKMACTIFTGGCNFRCPFCHNASLVLNKVTQPVISEEEVLEVLKNRTKVLEGVCITGGEPTLQKDLPLFIEKIKDLGYLVKLDTNGYRPGMLKYLLDSKLIDYAAMDIKNSKGKYSLSAGIDNIDLSPIEESINYIMNSNITYEFRTTVIAEHHTKEDFLSIADWLKGAKAYYLQAFKDSGDLLCGGLTGYSINELTEIKELIKDYFLKIEIRGVN